MQLLLIIIVRTAHYHCSNSSRTSHYQQNLSFAFLEIRCTYACEARNDPAITEIRSMKCTKECYFEMHSHDLRFASLNLVQIWLEFNYLSVHIRFMWQNLSKVLYVLCHLLKITEIQFSGLCSRRVYHRRSQYIWCLLTNTQAIQKCYLMRQLSK